MKDWEDWQRRVVDEKRALDHKRKLLDAFIASGSEMFLRLDTELLAEQSAHMNAYSKVLQKRIDRFKV